MIHPVARAVHYLSALHYTRVAVRSGKISMSDIARATIFSPHHFHTFLTLSMTASGLAGYYTMNYYQQRQLEVRIRTL
jgi:hypothetical protein